MKRDHFGLMADCFRFKRGQPVEGTLSLFLLRSKRLKSCGAAQTEADLSGQVVDPNEGVGSLLQADQIALEFGIDLDGLKKAPDPLVCAFGCGPALRTSTSSVVPNCIP